MIHVQTPLCRSIEMSEQIKATKAARTACFLFYLDPCLFQKYNFSLQNYKNDL